MNADEPDAIEVLHGITYLTGFDLVAGGRQECVGRVHGIVAKDAWSGVTNDFAARYIRHILGQEVQYGLRYPDTMTIVTI